MYIYMWIHIYVHVYMHVTVYTFSLEQRHFMAPKMLGFYTTSGRALILTWDQLLLPQGNQAAHSHPAPFGAAESTGLQ